MVFVPLTPLRLIKVRVEVRLSQATNEVRLPVNVTVEVVLECFSERALASPTITSSPMVCPVTLRADTKNSNHLHS